MTGFLHVLDEQVLIQMRIEVVRSVHRLFFPCRILVAGCDAIRVQGAGSKQKMNRLFLLPVFFSHLLDAMLVWYILPNALR